MEPKEVDHDEAIQDVIQQLVVMSGESKDGDVIAQMIQTVVDLARARTGRGDLKLINSALRELLLATRVFAPYRDRRKVTIFGSARSKEESAEYRAAADFGRLCVERGYMVITGAGDGIMRAGHEGAGADHSFGVNILLPFEQLANTVIADDPKLVTFKYFFTRKLVFMKESHAVALFPGGFGTQDEGFESLTLTQTGKAQMMPIVFIDVPGGHYWKDWETYVVERILGRGLISESDLHLFHRTNDIVEALDHIDRFYRVYHSLRFVRRRLVLRLRSRPSDELIERLNTDFADIVVNGRIEASGMLPDEANEPEIADLPRLLLPFNRRDYGRLRQLIDAVNDG